jgi:hypothetical protein
MADSPIIVERDEKNVKCDKCPAKATHRASFLNGPLYFCSHHLRYADRQGKLTATAIEIHAL